MRHRGTLFASDDAEGIIAVFVLDNDRFSLEVSREEWAGWHVSLISLAEIGVNEYQFDLNGDKVRFVPDSRLDFAYGAVPGLAKAQEEATKTYRARRKTKKATRSSSNGLHPKIAVAEPVVLAPPAPATNTTEIARPARKAPAKAKPAAAKIASPVTEPAREATLEVEPVAVAQITPEPAATEREPLPRTEPVVVAAAKAADPFSTDQPVAAEPEPAVPSTPNGQMVIDLRTTDGQPEKPAPPVKAPASTNGHHPAHAAKPDAKGGLRLLDRVRQSRAEHVHDYQVSSSGVMVRRVCSTCNHVSIGTAD